MKSIEEIKEIVATYKKELTRRYKVKEIEVFGSYVRAEQEERSDIDFLVDFDKEADLLDLSGLGLFLEEKLGEKVDIVPKRALRKELRRGILKEAVSI